MKVNGRTVLNDFDILAAAGGGNRAVTRESPANVGDEGILELLFASGENVARINAIQVFAASAGPG